MLVPKGFGLKNCSVQKNLGGTKLWSNKIRAPKKLIPQRLFKNLSVTAAIFLIWTNVTTKNVACTNVTMIVWICSIWSQEPTFEIWSKSGSLAAPGALAYHLQCRNVCSATLPATPERPTNTPQRKTWYKISSNMGAPIVFCIISF